MNDAIDAPASGPTSDRPRLRFSQETITIMTTAAAIAGLLLLVSGDISELRAEARADRQAFREEMHLLRAEARAEREQASAEARADRERVSAEARADRERADAAHRRFEAQILKLTEGQARLAVICYQRREVVVDPPV